ncbi:SusF/SusE family outer membrane protein [Flavihumibacter sp. R14]|nr:SusF/SusE family outer membrane protein [Flavihumibacter soli]
MRIFNILKTQGRMERLLSSISSTPSLFKAAYRPKGSTLMLLALLATMLASCEKATYEDLVPVEQNVPLALTASKTAVVLSEKNYDAEALALTWTSGTNNGSNSSISYKLLIDKQGNDFKNAVTLDLGKAVYSKTYSVKDLNSLLITGMHLAPGVESTLETRIITFISGNTVQSEASTQVIKVTPYQPVTDKLYLIGDATPNGWNAGAATELASINNIPGKFTWKGRLNAGEFKFSTVLGQFSPSYNKGADNSKLLYRTLDSQPDEKFLIAKAAMYTVTVNLLDLSIALFEGEDPVSPYTRLWMVGDATPNGWNIDNPNEMRVDSGNLFVFNYNAVFNAGEFKIPTAKGNWGADFYMPLVDAQALSLTGVSLVPGGSPDKKWRIANAGAYKVKLDLEAMKIYIKPFTAYTQLWIVGDATPTGWNIDSPTPLVPDAANPYVFTYTGALAAGEFKIPVKTGDWGGDFFMPEVNFAGAGSTRMKFVPGGSPDFKWKIAQAGIYKVTVDQLHETISIIKQ